MASVAAAAFEENRLSEERAVFQEQKKKRWLFHRPSQIYWNTSLPHFYLCEIKDAR